MRKKLSIMAAGAALLMVAGSASAAWTVDWTETLNLANNNNVYYSGGVFGGQYYSGYINYGPVAFDSTQTGGTALAGSFDDTTGVSHAAKGATLLNGKVYYVGDAAGTIASVDADWSSNASTLTLSDASATPEAITTDGTYLYTNDDADRSKIHQWEVNGSSLTLNATYDTQAGRIRAVSYYGGKLYAADHNGTSVYEVDVASGAVSTIGTTHTGAYQVTRLGNKVLITNDEAVGAELEDYDYVGGSLANGTTSDLGLGDLYGIAFDDANHAWVSSHKDGSGQAKVSYIAIPEPSVISMIALFGGGMVFIRRKFMI